MSDEDEPESYKRQVETSKRSRMPKFAAAVHFQSGFQFADRNSTPEQRAERPRKIEDAERRKVARQERERRDAEDRREREESAAEAERDRCLRREYADESLRSIRALMAAS